MSSDPPKKKTSSVIERNRSVTGQRRVASVQIVENNTGVCIRKCFTLAGGGKFGNVLPHSTNISVGYFFLFLLPAVRSATFELACVLSIVSVFTL